jgi:hypothetical protein
MVFLVCELATPLHLQVGLAMLQSINEHAGNGWQARALVQLLDLQDLY